MSKLIKNIILIFVLTVVSILFLSCKAKTKNVIFGNISLEIPETFKSDFIPIASDITNLVETYESYGLQTKNAIFSIVYTKYKKEYSSILNLDGAINGMIKNLKNNPYLREFRVISTDAVETMNAYVVVCGFYYGPNKTLNKAFLLLNDGLLQVMCIYNENNKSSQKEIDRIISSVKINN